jgi:hypothetical protein
VKEATQPTRRQNDQKQGEQHKQMQEYGCHQLKKKNDMKKKNVQKNNTKFKKKLGKQIILTRARK